METTAGFSIFPNPTDASFRLVFSEGMQPEWPLQVSVSDMTGRLVLSQMLQNEGDVVEVGLLIKGLYLVQAGNSVGKVAIGF
jgi:hypothetical protein